MRFDVEPLYLLEDMAKAKEKRLTKVQREILKLLNDGHIMKIDRMNMASIYDRDVAPRTRYFLTGSRYVTKGTSAESNGNGFVITDKGRKALLNSARPSRKTMPVVSKKERKCPGCELVKPIEDFVTFYGYANPRGKYCTQCFVDREQEFVQGLLDGRDFCLYCGKPITKAYEYTPDGKSKKTYISLDHMDPSCLGGHDTNENMIWCCAACNTRKGGKSFADWLKELESPYRELARKVYQEKHGRSPEEFEPRVGIVIDLTHVQENL